jgi:hypothetical protein
MDRKLFGLFTGTHLTIAFAIAVMAPSALYATVSYTAVGVVNPNTGTLAYVDVSGSLHTSDEYAYYRNNPLNYVQIQLSTGAGCATAGYAVPAGKALIITSIKGDYYNYDGTDTIVGLELYSGAGCTGAYIVTAAEPIAAVFGAVASKNYEYGNGIPVPAGSVVTAYNINDGGLTWVEGFLVPANLVSANSIIYEAKGATSGKPSRGLTP